MKGEYWSCAGKIMTLRPLPTRPRVDLMLSGRLARKARAAEFVRLGLSIYGLDWKRPTARLVGRSSKMVRIYATGSTDIPDKIMDALRRHADVGPAGEIIKKVIVAHLIERKAKPVTEPPKRLHEWAHDIAAEAVREMIKAGIMRSMDAP